MNKYLTIAALSLAGHCAAQTVPSDGTPPTTVVVNGVRNPELQPYRVMAAGFEAMEKHRALAPNAQELRFKLGPRKSAPPAVMSNLSLRLAGDNTDLAIPLQANHVFTLPRSESAARDNAVLQLNRNQNNIRWHPMIRSAGLHPGQMRLGDARMECQVLVAVGKKIAGFMISTAITGVLRSGDWCSAEEFTVPTFAERRISSATLLHDGERIVLRLTDDGAGFYAPVRDARYGNDDLIEVTFAEEPPGP